MSEANNEANKTGCAYWGKDTTPNTTAMGLHCNAMRPFVDQQCLIVDQHVDKVALIANSDHAGDVMLSVPSCKGEKCPAPAHAVAGQQTVVLDVAALRAAGAGEACEATTVVGREYKGQCVTYKMECGTQVGTATLVIKSELEGAESPLNVSLAAGVAAVVIFVVAFFAFRKYAGPADDSKDHNFGE